MKKIKISLLTFLATVLGSCANFLDIVPDNVATLENAFTMRNTAERYLFTCYSWLPNHGSLTNDPSSFAGGEMWTIYPYVTIEAFRLARGEQGIVSPLLNYWDGLVGGKGMFKGIRDCNVLLENIHSVPDMQADEKLRWEAEAKFLKAYYHFWLLRMYGPIPLIKENLPINSGLEEVRIRRQPVDEGFAYIVELLDEAIPLLPREISNTASELGRITAPAAMAIKAQILLYAASPLFNGNKDYANFKDSQGNPFFDQTYQVEKWKKAADACREAIEAAHAAGHRLYYFQPGFGQLLTDTTITQMSIRNSVCDRWNPEILWANSNSLPNQPRLTPRTWDPSRSISATNGRYGPTLGLVNLYYSKNGVPIEEDKEWDYAGRFDLKVGTKADKYNIKEGYTTAALHFDREDRFYAGIGFDGGIWYGQGRFDDNNTFFIEGKAGQAASVLLADAHSPTGYWAKKLIHFQNVIEVSSYSVVWYTWPIIRLSDLYLMYAEARNESGGPDAETYQYIDLVRARAALPGVEEAWSTYSVKSSKHLTKEGLREIIQQERQIELAMEGHRFWDLKRWKTAMTELNKPVSGWDIRQKEALAYYRESVIFKPEFKQKDYFFPIRENSLIENRNLVQNPGW